MVDIVHGMSTVDFHWNEEKNELLKASERDISFETTVEEIADGNLVEVLKHRSGAQSLLLVIVRGNYVYVVPAVRETNGTLFLKTAYPSRKFTRKYLGNNNGEK